MRISSTPPAGLQYIRYWEGKRDELDKEIKGVRGENLKGIHEELDQFAKIRATIDNLMDILGDMNTLTPEQHERSGFAEVLSALQKRLSE